MFVYVYIFVWDVNLLIRVIDESYDGDFMVLFMFSVYYDCMLIFFY